LVQICCLPVKDGSSTGTGKREKKRRNIAEMQA